ncbi:MAG TPA: hypothetical protein VE441_16220 [Mycobacterium sp.]|jgi:hypothetical protein|nr:hypothetical protein [Mycobacterium sp.]
MQPVQLSLMPDPYPTLSATSVEHLPEKAIAAAIALLAGVIAKTAAGTGIEVAADE